MNPHTHSTGPRSSSRTPRMLVAFAATFATALALTGCGEATTGDDPTARVPQAPVTNPSGAGTVVDRNDKGPDTRLDTYGR